MPAVAEPVSVVPGPVKGTRIAEAYARMVMRDAYFCAWPLINIYNKRTCLRTGPRARTDGERDAGRASQQAVDADRLHRTAGALGRMSEPGRIDAMNFCGTRSHCLATRTVIEKMQSSRRST
jgi:hypothetical protein